MNAARLRELLTHTEDNPALLDTRTYAEDQLWGGGDFDRLFSLPAGEAVTRLRELTEEAEAVKVNG